MAHVTARSMLRFGPPLVAATIAVAGVVGASAAVAAAPADPLGCASAVFDPTGVATPSLGDAVAAKAASLHADLHVRIERTVDGDIDAREAQLESQCAGWLGSDGLREPNLLVVSVSPDERQTLIAYGSDFTTALATAAPQIQQFVMNPLFKAGQVEPGLLAGLDAIAGSVDGKPVPGVSAPVFGGTDFTPDGGVQQFGSTTTSSDVPWGGVVGLIVLVSIAGGIGAIARRMGWSAPSGSARSRWASRGFSSSSSGSSFHSSHSSSSHSSSSHGGGGSSSSSW